MTIAAWIIQIMFVPVMAPLCVGLTRMMKARMQNRIGASPFQPYADVWKLFHKDEVISEDASWIFRCAPYIIFATTLVVAASIPLASVITQNPYTSDFLVIVYVLAFGTFFLALAGLDTGGGFGGFGSSREMMVAALAEGGLILSLLTVALLCGTTNLFAINHSIGSLSYIHVAALFFSFFGFLIALLAETSRYPFDNPATHLELTMIHEAMILEYSGKRLALIEWAAANKYVIFMTLASQLFFPWGIAKSADAGAVLIAAALLIAKLFIGCIAIAFLESSVAKLRIFKLPDLLWTSFVLSIVAIGLII